MTDPLRHVSRSGRDKAPPKKPYAMLAKLCHDPFFEEGWRYERKLDGERGLAVFSNDEVIIRSRNGKSLNNSYPELIESLQSQALPNTVLDGEIVAFERSTTSFSRLQQRMNINDPEEARHSNVAVYYYLFDIPFYDGADLSSEPLIQRKKVLREACQFNHRIRYSAYRVNNGRKYYRQAHKKNWEGIMAKQSDSPYMHGRSSKWLKFKCSAGQEFVIGGFTEPKGNREGFGALLLGVYDDGRLKYTGKVGTGYDDEFLKSFRRRMGQYERKTSPFDDDAPSGSDVHYLSPKLVCEVGFTEWTNDGYLRHPRFKGLRRDKNPKEVTRERG